MSSQACLLSWRTRPSTPRMCEAKTDRSNIGQASLARHILDAVLAWLQHLVLWRTPPSMRRCREDREVRQRTSRLGKHWQTIPRLQRSGPVSSSFSTDTFLIFLHPGSMWISSEVGLPFSFKTTKRINDIKYHLWPPTNHLPLTDAKNVQKYPKNLLYLPSCFVFVDSQAVKIRLGIWSSNQRGFK